MLLFLFTRCHLHVLTSFYLLDVVGEVLFLAEGEFCSHALTSGEPEAGFVKASATGVGKFDALAGIGGNSSCCIV